MIETKIDDNAAEDWCPYCGARFQYLCGATLNITWGDIVIDDKHYFVKVYPNIEMTGNAPQFIVYYAEEINLHGIPGLEWHDLLRLDFIPTGWTPQNIKQKIKEHLPFL
jgi:hypothetical protein